MTPILRRESDLRELENLVERLWGVTQEEQEQITSTVLSGIAKAQKRCYRSTVTGPVCTAMYTSTKANFDTKE